MFQIKEPRVPLDGRFIDKSVYCIPALALHLLVIHLFWGDLTNCSRGIPAPGPTSLLGLYFSPAPAGPRRSALPSTASPSLGVRPMTGDLPGFRTGDAHG